MFGVSEGRHKPQVHATPGRRGSSLHDGDHAPDYSRNYSRNYSRPWIRGGRRGARLEASPRSGYEDDLPECVGSFSSR